MVKIVLSLEKEMDSLGEMMKKLLLYLIEEIVLALYQLLVMLRIIKIVQQYMLAHVEIKQVKIVVLQPNLISPVLKTHLMFSRNSDILFALERTSIVQRGSHLPLPQRKEPRNLGLPISVIQSFFYPSAEERGK